MLATALFSVADGWDAGILPDSYTLRWYAAMLVDREVLAAIGRSFVLSGATVLVSLAVVTPAAFAVHLYYPRLVAWLRLMSLVPYALPGVILAVGLITLYSRGPLPIAGTFWILLAAYVVTCLPYTYTALMNSLEAVDARTLVQAAESLGASRAAAFRRVILPNVSHGLLSGGLLSFSVSLGEFVLANMLVGGRYTTLQLLLEKAMHRDGRLSSAMVMLYFSLVAAASLLMMAVLRRALTRSAGAAGGRVQEPARAGLQGRLGA